MMTAWIKPLKSLSKSSHPVRIKSGSLSTTRRCWWIELPRLKRSRRPQLLLKGKSTQDILHSKKHLFFKLPQTSLDCTPTMQSFKSYFYNDNGALGYCILYTAFHKCLLDVFKLDVLYVFCYFYYFLYAVHWIAFDLWVTWSHLMLCKKKIQKKIYLTMLWLIKHEALHWSAQKLSWLYLYFQRIVGAQGADWTVP